VEKQPLHPENDYVAFAEVILPLAVRGTFTYGISEAILNEVTPGKRVEVRFGKDFAGEGGNLMTGVVSKILEQYPRTAIKPIISVLDPYPLVHAYQLEFWEWMATYYACSKGEVMNAAFPAHFKLTGETIITLAEGISTLNGDWSDEEYLIGEALEIRNEITLDDVSKILQKNSIYGLIKRMLEKQLIFLKTDLKEKYTPKIVMYVSLAELELLEETFEKIGKSQRQTEALLAYIQLSKGKNAVKASEITKLAGADSSVLKAMEKKGIFILESKESTRLDTFSGHLEQVGVMSLDQQNAVDNLRTLFLQKNINLLFGVTGSGKTRVYIELIKEAINRGEQVLYLLPEIALTTQLTVRLSKIFGEEIGVYHSKMSNNERVELWNEVLNGKAVVLGARSALFLPFSKLKLIIVDEEHDASYKQNDPAPRYQGRDSAIYLGHLTGAKVLLGTATPSLESYFNVRSGKYGMVSLGQRFGGVSMPRIEIIDAKRELKKSGFKSQFTDSLLEAIQQTLDAKEQAILFQNRRGFAPTYRCLDCGWHIECNHCDVSLTYHKYSNELKCHYCGFRSALPQKCGQCGSKALVLVGFGTEKIEDELKIHFPEAKIGRMDLETVRTKHAHSRLIGDFEEKKIDILVGTQMVTKGLDFEDVGLVGIISADQLLHYPDFRSGERAFQLMAQVSGRAGRKNKQGLVLIQAFNISHPVLREVVDNDFEAFYSREIMERQMFKYPPYSRLIKITLKHKKPEVVNKAALFFSNYLKKMLGNRVIGPAVPYIGRVRSLYLLDIIIKLEKDGGWINKAKQVIRDATDLMVKEEGCSTVRIMTDVDPF
jgi:primosomal protein N' (replication factor Y) (superfamily II helicase)